MRNPIICLQRACLRVKSLSTQSASSDSQTTSYRISRFLRNRSQRHRQRRRLWRRANLRIPIADPLIGVSCCVKRQIRFSQAAVFRSRLVIRPRPPGDNTRSEQPSGGEVHTPCRLPPLLLRGNTAKAEPSESNGELCLSLLCRGASQR